MPQIRFVPDAPSGQAARKPIRFTPDAPKVDINSPAQRGRDPVEYGPAEFGFHNFREAVTSGLESAGVDLASPVVGTAKNIGGGLWNLAKRFNEEVKTPAGWYDKKPIVQEMAEGMAEGPQEIYAGAKAGDSTQIARGGGKSLAALLGIYTGTGRGRAVQAAAIEKVGSLPIKAGTAAVEKAKSVVTGVPLDPKQAMTKGLKPKATNLGFEMALDRAMPEINAIGKPKSVDELITTAKQAKKNVWSQYEQIAGPQAKRGVRGDAIADAMERSVPLKTRIQDPGQWESLSAKANTYRRDFKLEELEDMLHTTNAQLDAYYDKYPTAKRVAADKNPETAHLIAEAEATRKTIYDALDQIGGGSAPRELKQRYGALLNLEEEAYRRRNVALRQQPNSLSEQMGKWQAAMQGAKGAAKIVKGSPFQGAADIAGAYAGRKMATALKEGQTADALVRKAFERFDRMPEPVNYQAPKVKGLLGPGPMVTPPPADASFVRGVPAQPAKRSIKALLGEARQPIITPPPADTSFVKGMPATPARRRFPDWFRKVGGDLGNAPPERRLTDIVNDRMTQIKDLAQSGNTELTGKVKRLDSGEIVGRFGSGFREMFPELRGVPESPGRIADAIEKDGNNPLYLRIKKAVKSNLNEDDILDAIKREKEDSFDFGENVPKTRRTSAAGMFLQQRRKPKP